MNESNSKSDMLREIAIFEYVAGNQSNSAKLNFEKMMAQDASLREAVEVERQFRRDMQCIGESEPVSMSNFNSLLTTIEANEQESTTVSAVDNAGRNRAARVIDFSLSKYYATAASIAVVTMVLAGFYLDSAQPDFETLSNTSESEKVNFAQLVEQTRLAKMTVDPSLSQAEIEDILQRYELGVLDSGSTLNQRYVISKVAISQNQLERWRNDPNIQTVELFTHADDR